MISEKDGRELESRASQTPMVDALPLTPLKIHRTSRVFLFLTVVDKGK